tara:strand:- start:176 stop:352 length:177 start_codon:yes stop_codon:yes gene_type:complete
MKIIYYVLVILVIHATVFSQGVDFPNDPVQASIGRLWLLIAGGAVLAYKNFKKIGNLN